MNKVALIGNLVKDVEIRYTKDGMPVANFTIAVNKNEDITNFIPCKTFGNAAAKMDMYIGKGNKVGIIGELSSGKYEREGRTIYTLEVVTERVEYLTFKDSKENFERL